MSTSTNRLDAIRMVLRDCDYDFVVKDDYIVVYSSNLINEVVRAAGELGYEIRINTEENFVITRSIFE